MSIRERTARLTNGAISQEQPITPAPSTPSHGDRTPSFLPPRWPRKEGEDRTLEGELEEMEQWLRRSQVEGPPVSPSSPPLALSEPQVVTRPQWHGFLLCLQLHFPDIGIELEAAYKLGEVPPSRVVLSEEAISFLNHMIQVWYEGEVELTTVDSTPEARRALQPLQEVHYMSPFRPITGLNLIITPTVQWSLSRREQRILEEKSRWGSLGRFTLMKEAHRLLVKEMVPAATSRSKGSTGGLLRRLSRARR